MENRTKLERQGGGERLLEGAITAAGGGDHLLNPGASPRAGLPESAALLGVRKARTVRHLSPSDGHT